MRHFTLKIGLLKMHVQFLQVILFSFLVFDK